MMSDEPGNRDAHDRLGRLGAEAATSPKALRQGSPNSPESRTGRQSCAIVVPRSLRRGTWGRGVSDEGPGAGESPTRDLGQGSLRRGTWGRGVSDEGPGAGESPTRDLGQGSLRRGTWGRGVSDEGPGAGESPTRDLGQGSLRRGTWGRGVSDEGPGAGESPTRDLGQGSLRRGTWGRGVSDEGPGAGESPTRDLGQGSLRRGTWGRGVSDEGPGAGESPTRDLGQGSLRRGTWGRGVTSPKDLRQGSPTVRSLGQGDNLAPLSSRGVSDEGPGAGERPRDRRGGLRAEVGDRRLATPPQALRRGSPNSPESRTGRQSGDRHQRRARIEER